MTSSRTIKSSIVVLGASGYVGSHLVSKLAERGADVRCLVRRSSEPADMDFLRSCGARVFTGDLSSIDSATSPAFDGADMAVHLIGSIAPHKGENLQELHLRKTQHLIDECVAYQIPRVLLVSALGVSDQAKTKYHATKWQSEEALRSSQLQHLIARPSLIVGRQVGQRDSKLVSRYCQLILNRPTVPLIEGGTNKIQPVFIGDLAEALTNLIASGEFNGRAIELGGPEVVTMHQFVEMLMKVLGVDKPLSNVPALAARLAAFFCQFTQEVPLVTTDQVTLATTDNICRENRLEQLLGRRCTPLSQALTVYASQSSGL